MEKEILQLDKQVTSSVSRLDQINRHASPASVLGMVQNEVISPYTENRIQHRELSDGSSLAIADTHVRGKLREMPPGSIITYLVGRDPVDISRVDPRIVALRETVAMIAEHNVRGTVLIGAVRNAEDGSAQSQGNWGAYKLADGTVHSDKQDAISSLQRLFHPHKGVEATQMLSTVFSLANKNSSDSVMSAGCFSHEKPREAIPQNFLLGQVHFVSPVLLDADMPQMLLRLNASDGGRRVRPLISIQDELLIPEDQLLQVAYNVKATQLAAANPLGMGAGTSSEKVMESLMETTLGIEEVIGNGGTVAHGQQILRSHLGVR